MVHGKVVGLRLSVSFLATLGVRVGMIPFLRISDQPKFVFWDFIFDFATCSIHLKVLYLWYTHQLLCIRKLWLQAM